MMKRKHKRIRDGDRISYDCSGSDIDGFIHLCADIIRIIYQPF